MTITLHGDDVDVEQAAKQLYRLIDVLKVQDVTNEPTVEHELALVKVRATDANRAEIAAHRRARTRAGSSTWRRGSVIVEVTGTEDEIDELVALLRSVRHQGAGADRCGRHGAAAPAVRSRRHRAAEGSDDGARMYYDNDADRRRSPARRSPSSATAARATPTP